MATPEETIETPAPPPPATEEQPPVEETVASAVADLETAAKEVKKEVEDGVKEKKGDGAPDLKSTLLISGAVVAVIGAILAIFKKVKEAA